ncbi:MAG TPA: hypothetical protein VM509_08945, partial [Planctomycetota bacterium]|nr:hypothetical protein [Planctomycetota bacterium]
ADQTRCWEFLLRYAELVPSARATIEPLLRAAVRAHFKGEQYDDGAWGDMTFADFSMRTLNVGDASGCPVNLLKGLATMYRKGSALRTDATRAMFTAVLRSSQEHYQRKYGWLSTREERRGENPAGAELGVLLAAAEMLRNLSP